MNTALNISISPERSKLEAWVKRGQLFALVDAFFRTPEIGPCRTLETRDTDPLFYDRIAWEQVTYEAPSLVRVTEDTLGWLINALSTERWGVFIASNQNLETLARHFQKFVIAKGPDGNPYFLRFQDAAVLEVLLKTWDQRERDIFFGPAFAFGLPDLDSMEIALYEDKAGGGHPLPEDCLIQLRDSQLKLCSDAIDRDLVKVIYWHLRNHHSKAVQFLDKNILEFRIRFAIGRARHYGMVTISDLAGFSALMFELAPNFDQHPSFKQVFENREIPPDAKMRYLAQTITEREWKEVLLLYDRTFWPAYDALKVSK